MKRSRAGALLRGAMAIAVLAGPLSCQRILGIHGNGTVADAASDPAPDVTDAKVDRAPAEQSVADAADDIAVSDDARDAAAGDPVGSSIDAPIDAGPDGGVPADASDGSAPPDLAARDASPEVSPPDAGPKDTTMGDTASCAQPWHAENVQARLMTPGTGATACSVAAANIPTLAAAVDATTFRGAQACGACLRVQGTLSTNAVVVTVVERSDVSGVLLTRAAMDQLTPGGSLIAVDWQLVPCDTREQPLHYYVKEGSNAGYVGVQIRNARYPIASVAAVGARTSVALELQPYNYWESTAVGGGPLTLRVTDINGQVVEDPGIKVVPQTETVGQGQFPLCR